MTITQLTDAIRVKSAELEVLTAKAEPTSDDLKAATALNDEIDSLTGQVAELKKLEDIKVKNAQRIAEQKTVVNALPTAPQATTVKVGESSAKANMPEAEYKAYVTGLFVHGLSSETSRQKFTETTGVEYKTHLQSNDATGGIFVPQETSSYIINLKDQYGVFRRNSRVEGMGSESVRIFRVGDDLTAYWGAENTNYTASDMEFNQITLTAKKLTALAIISEELSMNATQSLGQRFAEQVARQFAKKEDLAGFLGDGTSTYGGITGLAGKLRKVLEDGGGTWTTDADKAKLGSNQNLTGNLFSEALIGDFITGIRKVPTYALSGAKWYIHRVAFGATAERLAIAAGGTTAAEFAGSFGTRFLGYPVEFVDVMPSADANSQVCAWFGNLSLASTFGDRQSVSVKTDTSLGFQNDTIYVKANQYVDINVHEMGNYHATAASRVTGPIVGFTSLNA